MTIDDIPNWKPIAEHSGTFMDGEKYLVALRVVSNNTTAWEFHKVQIRCDEDTFELNYADDDDLIGSVVPFDAWTWDCFEYFIQYEAVE